jgi:alanyl-tRNA synthetase/misacylated tRNA(Ala) deacylase
MDTKQLYLDNQYLKEADATALWFEFTDLILDQTIFYPTMDGQPNDKGKVIIDNKEYLIVDTWQDGSSIHLMSLDTFPPDTKGKKVHQVIDWDVRYLHMRFRTALKVLTALTYSMFKGTTRINQTYDTEAWFDIEVETLTQQDVESLIAEANKILKSGKDVTFSYIDREEFVKDSNLMKICKGKLPDGDKMRVMHIDGLPSQLEFGTNVANTKEVGTINYKTTLTKGILNKRVNITLSP